MAFVGDWFATRKKQYNIWGFPVKRGTPSVHIQNKLTGKYYATDPTVNSWVLSGTRGELSVLTDMDLRRQYHVDTFLDWEHDKRWVRIVPNIDTYPYMARLTDGKPARLGKLIVNQPGCKHGAGDFIVAKTDGTGRPVEQTAFVVNGMTFIDTFNLTQSKLSQGIVARQITEPRMPDTVPIDVSAKDIYKMLAQRFEQCFENMRTTQTRELPFHISRDNWRKVDEDTGAITYKYVIPLPKAISELKEANLAYLGVKVTITNRVKIEGHYLNKKKQSRGEFKFYYPFGSTAEIPMIDSINRFPQGEKVFQGLLGYIPSTAMHNESYAPDAYKAIADYTMTSGTINSLCRCYITPKSHCGKSVEDILSAAYTIPKLDKTFDECAVSSASGASLYRGQVADTFLQTIIPDLKDCVGKSMENMAYNSFSYSLNSALFFASHNCGKVADEGILYCIDNATGLSVHNIAGWNGQYEFLCDRNIDLHITNILTTISCNFEDKVSKLYIVSAEPVPHIPYKPFSAEKRNQLHKYGCDDVDSYDTHGRVPVRDIIGKNMMFDAFTILREKGYSVQYQNAFEGKFTFNDGMTNDIVGKHSMIVARGNNREEADDMAFVFDMEMQGDVYVPFLWRVHIKGTKALQNISEAPGLYRQSYGLRDKFDEIRDEDTGEVKNPAWFKDYQGSESDIDLNKLLNSRIKLYLEATNQDMPHRIASRIEDYIKVHKEIEKFNVIDTARYLCLAMQDVLQSEYIDYNTVRPEYNSKDNTADFRIGLLDSSTQHQAGEIVIRLEKTNTGRVLVRYGVVNRKDGKLEDSVTTKKRVSLKFYNEVQAYKLAYIIIWDCLDKAMLNRNGRIRRVLDNYTVPKHFRYTKAMGSEADRHDNAKTRQTAEKEQVYTHEQILGIYKVYKGSAPRPSYRIEHRTDGCIELGYYKGEAIDNSVSEYNILTVPISIAVRRMDFILKTLDPLSQVKLTRELLYAFQAFTKKEDDLVNAIGRIDNTFWAALLNYTDKVKYNDVEKVFNAILSYRRRVAVSEGVARSLRDRLNSTRDGDLHNMLLRLLQNTVKIVATDSFNGFLPEVFNGYAKLMKVNPCIPKAVNIGCRLGIERGKHFEW